MMIRNIATYLCAGLILASCGASKKLDSANAQIAELNSQLAGATAKQSESEKLVSELQKANEINSRDAADCRIAKEALRNKKEKLDQELAARGTSLTELQTKAETAVRNLREAGHEVTYENGRFHIIVADEFGYKSGSAIVGPKGREALNVVAQIMYDNWGVSAVIVGHTDTVSIRGVADNWSLSTERANAVVRVLEDVYNINPSRLTAAGSSKFNPRASNATEEGRSMNRRIEIFINPRLERVWSLLED
jgi:chemotaxis protein MotB